MFGKKQDEKVSTQIYQGSKIALCLTDPVTGHPLTPKVTPGYYPGFHTLDQQKFWDAKTREVVLNRVNRKVPIRFFTKEEVDTMQAVIDCLIPQDDRAVETRIPILSGLDERLFLNHIEGYRYEDMPSDQSAYRLGAKALEAMAQELQGKQFSQLLCLEQEIILQSLHDGEPLAATNLWKQMNLKRFWSMLLADCCAVYYAHPFAWDEIGFGGPAYPRGYMRLEEGEAEPWEVEERRYEWVAPSDTLSDSTRQSGHQKPHRSEEAGVH